MFSTTPSSPTAATFCDRAAVAVIVLVALAVTLTFRDYGLGWDDFTHAQYGALLLDYYASGFERRDALSFVNLYMYGGGFDMAAGLLAKILPLELFEARRLAGGLIGVVGLAVTFRIARRLGGPVAGLVATALLASCPLFFGHMLINAKDAPFAVAMTLLLLGMVRVIGDYPRPSIPGTLLFGLGLGLAFGSRTLGLLAGVDMLAALGLLVIVEARHDGLRAALLRALSFLARLLPGFLLAYAVMAIVWPWSVQDLFNPVRAITYFSHFFEAPWRERFGGALILVPDMPRRYLPTLLALQLPVIFLALALSGAIGAAYVAMRGDAPLRQRAALLCVLTAAVFPIALALALRPAMYNGIRHFLFLLPPLAVLGGWAGAALYSTLGSRLRVVAIAALAAGLLLPVVEMVRLHPYQYTYYNQLIGGVAGAQGRYMLDFWGLSFKQASQALAKKIAADGIAKPADRPWKLAVCGPHRSPQVELGPDFETTWDPKGADFAITLGVFYCRQLDAPVIAEIRRDGVLYARVYDLRGTNFDTLLNPYPGQK